MPAENLPSLLGPTGAMRASSRRDLARVDRTADRDIAVARGRARVLTERAISSNRAIENVATDAMRAGTGIASTAVSLADACPAAEGMLRTLLDESARSLGYVINDLARDLRG